ncbi:MAG TPA: AgmX/PglI C-terminal domain-containing protein [Myxococcota bacterium]|jgi:serine/threonine-protein kinase|nr:AgmX/PglI C-terminal domain-containing protein [Myxococcota bacterium]
MSLVGTTLGAWRLTAVLEEAGTGHVYRAEAAAESAGGAARAGGGPRVAAVKVLRAELAAQGGVAERFLSEARAARLLRHEGTPQVYDCGRTPGGAPYVVMELLAGESLAERLARDGRLAPAEVARLVTRIAAVLDAEHARGNFHGDFKPRNVFLLPVGAGAGAARAGSAGAGAGGGVGADVGATRGRDEERVKVLGFGIAKLLDPRRDGAAAYLSPEQCRGARDVDFRSDLYSLAAVAYEALCGRPPFLPTDQQAGGDVLEMHRTCAPVPLVARDASIPEAVDEVVARALAKEPAARFASAADFAEALRAAAAGMRTPGRVQAMGAGLAPGPVTSSSTAALVSSSLTPSPYPSSSVPTDPSTDPSSPAPDLAGAGAGAPDRWVLPPRAGVAKPGAPVGRNAGTLAMVVIAAVVAGSIAAFLAADPTPSEEAPATADGLGGPESWPAATPEPPETVAAVAPTTAVDPRAIAAVPVDPEAHRSVVDAHADQVRRCYDKALRKNPELAGDVVVEVSLLPTGRVAGESTWLVTDEPGDAGLSSCLTKRIAKWRFTAGPDAPAVFRLRFHFAAPEAPAPGGAAPEAAGRAALAAALKSTRKDVMKCVSAADLPRSTVGTDDDIIEDESTVAFTVKLDADGTVTSVKVKPPYGAGKLGACISAAVSKADYPAPGAPTSVNYKFRVE